jgi:hypothetical protein
MRPCPNGHRGLSLAAKDIQVVAIVIGHVHHLNMSETILPAKVVLTVVLSLSMMNVTLRMIRATATPPLHHTMIVMVTDIPSMNTFTVTLVLSRAMWKRERTLSVVVVVNGLILCAVSAYTYCVSHWYYHLIFFLEYLRRHPSLVESEYRRHHPSIERRVEDPIHIRSRSHSPAHSHHIARSPRSAHSPQIVYPEIPVPVASSRPHSVAAERSPRSAVTQRSPRSVVTQRSPLPHVLHTPHHGSPSIVSVEEPYSAESHPPIVVVPGSQGPSRAHSRRPSHATSHRSETFGHEPGIPMQPTVLTHPSTPIIYDQPPESPMQYRLPPFGHEMISPGGRRYAWLPAHEEAPSDVLPHPHRPATRASTRGGMLCFLIPFLYY